MNCSYIDVRDDYRRLCNRLYFENAFAGIIWCYNETIKDYNKEWGGLIDLI